MYTLLQLLVISVSLALDAFSVSIAGGMKSQTSKISHAIKVSLFFGIFQAFMPILGWLIGESMKDYIIAIDHWIAFILLGIIGIKMIKEALDKDVYEKKDIINTKTLLILSTATSIDALIIGITLPLLQVPFFTSIMTIGIITFILCFFGFVFGKKIGALFGKKIEILGGIALIAIGLKILIEHLVG